MIKTMMFKTMMFKTGALVSGTSAARCDGRPSA
jgi:hypothetical protein